MRAAELRTDRLLLRPFQPEDTAELFSFMRDAAAMEHTYVAPSIGHCRARLHAYEAMRPTLGFAPWVLRTSEGGPVIGWGGLCIDPDEPAWGVEVAYALAPGAWGRGYASELVMYALAWAFQILGATEVHAYARPANLRSIRVLQKAGMTLLRYEPRLRRHHYRIVASAG